MTIMLFEMRRGFPADGKEPIGEARVAFATDTCEALTQRDGHGRS